ncbi:hypothetical protein [Synechococcus sp. MIT S9504]|uniref:hypothetical protein n=1 Tax=Synechococcus sp. MIT S9504 TaxID=1801628 RepID=UPI0012E730DF|nr:hypothetical protein [Synechococcus sp. MIT S9504]
MTVLGARPVAIRLAVALTCDASVGGFPRVKTESTWGRFESLFSENSPPVHPYTEIWNVIGNYYESWGWQEKCDQTLNAEIAQMAENGFPDKSGKFISCNEMKKAAARWREYGWYDYEMRRASKWRKVSKHGSRVGILALAAFGIPMIDG